MSGLGDDEIDDHTATEPSSARALTTRGVCAVIESAPMASAVTAANQVEWREATRCTW